MPVLMAMDIPWTYHTCHEASRPRCSRSPHQTTCTVQHEEQQSSWRWWRNEVEVVLPRYLLQPIVRAQSEMSGRRAQLKDRRQDTWWSRGERRGRKSRVTGCETRASAKSPSFRFISTCFTSRFTTLTQELYQRLYRYVVL